ncbi:MAG: hypothetical protein ACI4V5_07695 [Prevotella sp.]
MKKILRITLLALLALVCNTSMAGEVKLVYSGGTTNMTGGNDAALLGLDAEKWSVVAAKGGHSSYPGLNTSGEIRLYYHANGGNTITVTAIGAGMTINKIKNITFSTNYENAYVKVGDDVIAADTNGEYEINGTSFVIGNANTTSAQVRIKSILLDVTGDGQEINHIENTPSTAYSVEKAIELINAGESLDEFVYVKGKISTLADDAISVDYGNATYCISDDGTTSQELKIYRGYYLENTHFTSTDQLKLGDEVIVYGNILNYSGTMEMNSGNYIYSLNGVTTGINGIVADEVNADAPMYNLAGQRVNKNVKGILIKNGKAFINK